MLAGGTGNNIAAGDPVLYVGPGVLEVTANVDRARVPVPAGTLSTLRVRTDVASFVGSTVIVTVNVNGLDTGITCSITGASDSCTDAVNTVGVAAGATVALRLEQTGVATPTRVNYSLQLQLP